MCLSVNQASSIQNYGVTCESITVGHNPSKLPLTAGRGLHSFPLELNLSSSRTHS